MESDKNTALETVLCITDHSFTVPLVRVRATITC